MLLKLIINRSTHKEPVKVHHGTSGMQVQFKIYVNCDPGDNPAHVATSAEMETIHAGNAPLAEHNK